MPWINNIVSWFNTKRLHQLDLAKKYPFETQHDTFSKLIEKAEETQWGKKYGYKSIKDYSDYQKRVPIQDYDDIKPFIIRLKQGEKDVLWPGSIKWFAKSSGTTTDKSEAIVLYQLLFLVLLRLFQEFFQDFVFHQKGLIHQKCLV